MSILRFDEARLITELGELSPPLRTAFAAAVAERLFPGIGAPPGGGSDSLLPTMRAVLDRIWQRVENGATSEPPVVQQDLSTCQSLMDQHVEDWPINRPFAEDAVAAIGYTLRCESTAFAQEAAYAARRGYEAADRYVVESSQADMNQPNAEARVLSSGAVQDELLAQRADLRALRSLEGPDKATLQALRAAAARRAHHFVVRSPE